MKIDKATLICLCCVLAVGGVLLYVQYDYDMAIKETESFIYTMGYDIIECEIESPSIIIPVDDVHELLLIGYEQNATVVYKQVRGSSSIFYYVFNEDYSIAWRATA